MVKFSPWDHENFDEICDIDSAVTRWNNFLRTASQDVLNSIQ